MSTKLLTKRGVCSAVAAVLGGALLIGTAAPAVATTAHAGTKAKPTVVPARDVLAVHGPITGRHTVVLTEHEKSVQAGDVLVAGPGKATPHGMLVKVVSVKHHRHSITAVTRPAPLSAALAPGHYGKTIDVRPTAAGARHANISTGPIGWSVPISKGVQCDGNVTATIDGSLTINPTADVELNVDLFGVHSASLSLSMSEDATLKATLSAAAHCTATAPILSNVAIGGFFIGPVYVQPTFSLTLDALLNANASVTISGAQHFRGSVGVGYDENSGLYATKSATNTFDFAKPQLTGSATLEGGVTASMALLIAGLAGPRVDARGYLGITADSSATPWWTLYGGITVTGGIQVLAWNIGNVTIWAQRWTLLQALGLSGHALPTAAPGRWYAQQVQAVGGIGADSYALTSGSLPAGLSMNSAGVISGVPTPQPTTQTSSFVVTVHDSTGAATSAPFSITVPGLGIGGSSTLPQGLLANDYSYALQPVGVVGTPTWQITAGALPAGLSLGANGVISGVPTALGTANFTVTLSDSAGGTVSKAVTLSVIRPIVRCGLKGCPIEP